MECGKAEVPGFGKGQGRLDGFQVPELAHEDHVRVLAQDVFQGVLEAFGVGPP